MIIGLLQSLWRLCFPISPIAFKDEWRIKLAQLSIGNDVIVQQLSFRSKFRLNTADENFNGLHLINYLPHTGLLVYSDSSKRFDDLLGFGITVLMYFSTRMTMIHCVTWQAQI